MKTLTLFLVSMVLASFSFGCAQGQTQLVSSHLSERTSTEWSVEDHREEASLYELEAQRLEAKVAHLKKRVETYKKKPYRDSKGFKRDSLKRLMGVNQKSLKLFRQHVAWHHAEAERLTALNSSEGIEQSDTQQKGS